MTRTNEAGVVHLLDRPRWREAARRHGGGSQLLGYQLGSAPLVKRIGLDGKERRLPPAAVLHTTGDIPRRVRAVRRRFCKAGMQRHR